MEQKKKKISYETHRSVVYKEGNPSQMATLNDMLLAELIKIGDKCSRGIKRDALGHLSLCLTDSQKIR